jgi:hypothetical protein
MVILRATQKLLRVLAKSADSGATSDTALGDWYVNRLVVDRRPLLILLSARSLLPVLLPAREVRALPDRLPAIVGARLNRLGVAPSLIEAELAAMTPVSVGKTVDRSVLGIMVDFAKDVPFYLEAGRWDETSLRFVETRLAETPCYAGRRFEEVIFPKKKASELLAAQWGTATAFDIPNG